MPAPDLQSAGFTRAPEREQSRYLVAKSGAYILIVLTVIFGASVYSFWEQSIFDCQASGYGSDGYLAYCGGTGYGDYDYGAFWFGLEPEATDAAASAQVLFVGNSRMQFGFSTEATKDWFSSLPAHYYLLGFAYNGNHKFEEPLLRKLRPKAKVFVINLDLFFDQTETPPARTVMRDPAARTRYERKRQWQRDHISICTSLAAVCGNAPAFFRSRATGAWLVTGGQFTGKPVSYDSSVDQNVLNAYTTSGNRFLSGLPVPRECALLTMVPTVDTSLGTAKAIAVALGLNLVAPELPGLNTFDGSHLDLRSAQRWSMAFMEVAGPQIRKCLDETPDPPSQSQMPDDVTG